MATTKQLNLIQRLALEREVPDRWRGMVHAVVWDLRHITDVEAAGLIRELLKAERR
jgi:hypothetical protein